MSDNYYLCEDYIFRDAAIVRILKSYTLDTQEQEDELIEAIKSIKAADVRPVEHGENLTENNPVDEFVCSECGIIIEDWSMVEIDEDDGERTNHEYVFRFCPNCGADIRGEANEE